MTTKTVMAFIAFTYLSGCEREILTSDYNYCPVVASSGVEGDAEIERVWQRHSLPLDLVVTPGFSCSREEVYEAALFWEAALGYPAFKPAVEGPWAPDQDLSGGKAFLRTSSSLEDYVVTSKDSVASAQTRCWIYDGDFPNDTLNCGVTVRICDWRILAHELGHVLGFGSGENHSERFNDIMNESLYLTNDNYSISPSEVDLLNYWCSK